ncbi:hypothetical protein GCM10023152_20760 [Agromyces bauzanensis]|uniref:Uncharacterized protein n=1 Tax=Agromyces bauzanensis TaxID=1308924 RepID=A0A917PNV3_9MICO|nr:hypothetical protein GCM10011372_24580 [Agromyces bauzanensis]
MILIVAVGGSQLLAAGLRAGRTAARPVELLLGLCHDLRPTSPVGHILPQADRRPPAEVAIATVSSSPVSSTSVPSTFAPSRARRSTSARPIPLAAPVMIATLPASQSPIPVSFVILSPFGFL